MKIPSIPGFEQGAFEKYFKNTGWLMLARVGSLLIKVLAGISVSNYLLAERNGMLSYPMVIVTFFLAASALGLDGFVTREIIRHPENKDTLLGTAFRMRLLAALALLPVLYLVWNMMAQVGDPGEKPFRHVFIVGLSTLLQSVNIIDGYFQSKVQGKVIMCVQVSANVLSACFKLSLIVLGCSLEWFVWALLLDAFLLSAGYVVAYQWSGERFGRWKYDGAVASFLLKHSWPLIFSAILITVYMKIDQLMIEHYLGVEALGVYTQVVSLSESWYFIPIAIASSVFPVLVSARNSDPDRYWKRLQNLYDLMVVLSVGLALVTTFCSTFIFHVLFAPSFWGGAPVLSVHIWAGVFVFLGTASGQYLVAEGYTGLSMLRTAVGAIVNIVLNVIWIPKWGIMGAAYATLIAYAVSTLFIVVIPKTRQSGKMMLMALFFISPIRKFLLLITRNRT